MKEAYVWRISDCAHSIAPTTCQCAVPDAIILAYINCEDSIAPTACQCGSCWRHSVVISLRRLHSMCQHHSCKSIDNFGVVGIGIGWKLCGWLKIWGVGWIKGVAGRENSINLCSLCTHAFVFIGTEVFLVNRLLVYEKRCSSYFCTYHTILGLFLLQKMSNFFDQLRKKLFVSN